MVNHPLPHQITHVSSDVSGTKAFAGSRLGPWPIGWSSVCGGQATQNGHFTDSQWKKRWWTSGFWGTCFRTSPRILSHPHFLGGSRCQQGHSSASTRVPQSSMTWMVGAPLGQMWGNSARPGLEQKACFVSWKTEPCLRMTSRLCGSKFQGDLLRPGFQLASMRSSWMITISHSLNYHVSWLYCFVLGGPIWNPATCSTDLPGAFLVGQTDTMHMCVGMYDVYIFIYIYFIVQYIHVTYIYIYSHIDTKKYNELVIIHINIILHIYLYMHASIQMHRIVAPWSAILISLRLEHGYSLALADSQPQKAVETGSDFQVYIVRCQTFAVTKCYVV